MFRIAVLQFPGTNCENETKRSLENAGLQADFVRWNERDRIKDFDGYVLPGGFAYEDRSRAGIIASQDPIIGLITEQADTGKPVIGICNGCQILIETGMVPGLDNHALAGAVAMNTRVREGEIIGTGFYHDTIYMQSVSPKGRSAVTMNYEQCDIIPASVANGEGRFIFSNDLLMELEKHNQILFKYSTEDGKVLNEFPTTPNGAEWGIAGLCNKEGNVVAYMPHPERFDTGIPLFDSLKTFLEEKPKQKPYSIAWQPPANKVAPYDSGKAIELYVDLIITDKAAKSVELVLQQKGYTNVTVTRKTHWEVWHSAPEDQKEVIINEVVQSGELLNTNKEIYTTKHVVDDKMISFLVRYSDDYEGRSVTKMLQDRLQMHMIENIRKGVVWELHIDEDNAGKRLEIATEILQTYILYNPYSQECTLIK